MANKRIRKKQITRLAVASSGPPRTFRPEEVRLEIACPSCRRYTLLRTYVPRLGSMNGTVLCSRCEYRDQFANTIALIMQDADPVPEAFMAPRTEAVDSALRRASLLHEIAAFVAAKLRPIGRAWREATAPLPRQPLRRLERAHSAVH